MSYAGLKIHKSARKLMPLLEAAGDFVTLSGLGEPDLRREPETKTWWKVIIGMGSFTVRAASEEYAMLKAERRANELRNSVRAPIETTHGLPLVLELSKDDQAFYERTWHSNKPDADLTELIVSQPFPGIERPNLERELLDPNQGELF